MEEEHVKNIPELRSEEVQEVLGWIPPWILRCGITVLFLIVVTLFVGSWFYKYPEIIEAPMLVTSHNPPVDVNARVNGKITQLLVTDRQQVKAADYLAVIENPANIDDVGQMREKLMGWMAMAAEGELSFTAHELSSKYELGDMQSAYLGFIRAAINFSQFVELDYFNQRIAAVEEQIVKQRQLYERLHSQNIVSQQQHALAHRQYVRDSTLYVQKISSEAEHDVALNIFLQSRQSLEASRIALDNVNMQITQLLQTILDLKLQETERSGQLLAEINAGLNSLLNAFNVWEMTYVLKTPVDGTVDISKVWNENQNIIAGETIFTIIPLSSRATNAPNTPVPARELAVIGRAQLPIAGSGKVKTGQAVNARFLNFPDLEYGIVRGIVANISITPVGDAYIVEIIFPNGLTTTYGTELPFHPEMRATAEIITEDLRLLERLFMQLKKIFSEK